MGSRNENSVKNRFFSLKRRYMKLYKQMPQSEKKMLIFLSQKIRAGPSVNLMEIEDADCSPKNKKVKKNPVHLKKRGLTLDVKKARNVKANQEDMTSSIKLETPFQLFNNSNHNTHTPNTRTTLNPSLTHLTLSSLEKMESVKQADIRSMEKDKDSMKKDTYTPPNDPQCRMESPRRFERRCNTYNKQLIPEEEDAKHLSAYYVKHLNLYEIPNMYKKPETENQPNQPMLLYPNKNIMQILKNPRMPFDLIKEESSVKESELSQMLSSMSLIDQYLTEGTKILSSLSFRPNNNSLSSGKVINNSISSGRGTFERQNPLVERNNSKRKTVNLTNYNTILNDQSPSKLMHKKSNSAFTQEYEFGRNNIDNNNNINPINEIDVTNTMNEEMEFQPNYNLEYYQNDMNYNRNYHPNEYDNNCNMNYAYSGYPNFYQHEPIGTLNHHNFSRNLDCPNEMEELHSNENMEDEKGISYLKKKPTTIKEIPSMDIHLFQNILD